MAKFDPSVAKSYLKKRDKAKTAPDSEGKNSCKGMSKCEGKSEKKCKCPECGKMH